MQFSAQSRWWPIDASIFQVGFPKIRGRGPLEDPERISDLKALTSAFGCLEGFVRFGSLADITVAFASCPLWISEVERHKWRSSQIEEGDLPGVMARCRGLGAGLVENRLGLGPALAWLGHHAALEPESASRSRCQSIRACVGNASDCADACRSAGPCPASKACRP